MRCAETVRLDPGKRQAGELRLLGDRVSRLWNSANHLCRQAFLAKEGVPVGAELERRMKDTPDYRQLPSDVAQEVLKKLSEGWKSYFALRTKWVADPAANQKPGFPRYRKDKKTGLRPFDWIPFKHPRCYALNSKDASLILPRDRRRAYGSANGRLHIAYRGRRRIPGKMGRAEALYDRVRRRWHFYWAVLAADPEPVGGERTAALDLGVRISASLSIEGQAQALHFEARETMKDWDWLGREIAREQAHLAGTRGKERDDRAPSSRNVGLLHAKRRGRLEHALRCMAKAIAEACAERGVSKVFMGHPKNILRDVRYGSAKWAGRIHAFWSFDQVLATVAQALRRVGIAAVRVGERGSSSTCCFCDSANIVRHPRWRIRCEDCGERIHSDQSGSRCILRTNKPSASWAGLEASPLTETRRWTRHQWEARSANPGRGARSASPEFLLAA